MRGWGTGDEEGEISFGVKGFFFVGKPDGKFCTIWLLSSFFGKRNTAAMEEQRRVREDI